MATTNVTIKDIVDTQTNLSNGLVAKQSGYASDSHHFVIKNASGLMEHADGGYFDPRNFGTGARTGANIALACQAANAYGSGRVILSGGTYAVNTGSLNFLNIPIDVMPGSYMIISAGDAPSNLKIYGDYDYQIFSCATNDVPTIKAACIRPEHFGSVSGDCSTVINLADKCANLSQVELRFGAKTYLVNTWVVITSSWAGIPNSSTIKFNGSGTAVNYCSATGQSNFKVKDLIFDGNVSADPEGGWNSGNYDSFTGGIGLSIEECADFIIQDCTNKNSVRGFRLWFNANGSLVNCKSIKCRGNFGDGFLSVASSNISFINCYAYDYTRIGFVSEGYAVSEYDNDLSYYDKYVNCYAEYGHNGSAAYGGIENNAGFWIENAGFCKCVNCHAIDNKYGFVTSAGYFNALNTHEGLPSYKYATFDFKNCSARNITSCAMNYFSSQTTSFITVDGCDLQSDGDGISLSNDENIDGGSLNGNTSLTVTNSTIEYDNVNSVGIYMSSSTATYPKIIAENVTFIHKTTDGNRYNNAKLSSSGVGDFGTYESNIVLKVRNCRVHDDTPVIFKFIDNYDHSFEASSMKASFLAYNSGLTGGAIIIKDCDIYGINIENNSTINISRCTFNNNSIYTSPVNYLWTNNGIIYFKDNVINLTTSYLEVGAENFNSVNYRIFIEGNKFSKDILTNDYQLKLKDESSTHGKCLMKDNFFYNSGNTCTTKAFIYITTNTAVSHLLSYSDANTSHVINNNGSLSSDLTGYTQLTMH